MYGRNHKHKPSRACVRSCVHETPAIFHTRRKYSETLVALPRKCSGQGGNLPSSPHEVAFCSNRACLPCTV